jgi:hypothetical protein
VGSFRLSALAFGDSKVLVREESIPLSEADGVQFNTLVAPG